MNETVCTDGRKSPILGILGIKKILKLLCNKNGITKQSHCQFIGSNNMQIRTRAHACEHCVVYSQDHCFKPT